MSRPSEQEILTALAQVRDPDLNRDIVSLGFVKNLKIEEDRVAFDVELTTPACPVKDQLRRECEQRVAALGVARVEVNMTARVRAAATPGRQSVPGVANLLAVASGKGGVGKSTVTMNLALALAETGARVGVLDCDFYGPSLPSMVGLHKPVMADGAQRLHPNQAHGLKLMSMGFLIERIQPVSWRGPMLHKMIQQFLYNANWGTLDYLVLDLPPGTGDVQLSLTQSVPLAGALLVTTPQEAALMDVDRGLTMFQGAKVPVLGIVENMSYYLCGKCSKKHRIFGEGGAARIAQREGIPMLGELPLDPVVPSDLGRGEPLMVRRGDHPAAEIFRQVAGRLVAELSKRNHQWAESGPGAMEV